MICIIIVMVIIIIIIIIIIYRACAVLHYAVLEAISYAIIENSTPCK